jgi:hypothetical protein
MPKPWLFQPQKGTKRPQEIEVQIFCGWMKNGHGPCGSMSLDDTHLNKNASGIADVNECTSHRMPEWNLIRLIPILTNEATLKGAALKGAALKGAALKGSAAVPVAPVGILPTSSRAEHRRPACGSILGEWLCCYALGERQKPRRDAQPQLETATQARRPCSARRIRLWCG